MNILTIIIIAIFLLFMILGYRKGLVRTVLKFVLAVVAFFLAYLLTPVLTDVLIKNTRIDDYIIKKIDNKIYETTKQKIENEMNESYGMVNEQLCSELTDRALNTTLTRSEEIEFINSLKLPQYVSTALIENNNKEVMEELSVDSFYDYLAIYVARMILRAVVFGFLYLSLWIIFKVIMLIAMMAASLPVVSTANKIAGMLFGLLEALIIVWVFFAIVSVFINTDFGTKISEQVEQSPLLKMLFDKNIIINTITDINNT